MIDDLEVPAEVRAAFAAGPGPEPALRTTPEQVLATGRRSLRRRRVVGAGASALAVAAVVAGVTVLAPAGGSDGNRTAAVEPAPAAAPTTAAARPGIPTASPVDPARLTAALRAAVPLPPGARLGGGISPEVGPLEFRASQGGWKAGADVRDAAGVGSLLVWLDPPGMATGDPCEGAPECRVRTVAEGRLTTQVRRTGAVVVHDVVLQRTGGGVVYVSGRNVVPGPDGEERAGRPTPPWTLDQLVAIALTPGLRV